MQISYLIFMNIAKVDLINIALMFFSVALALLLPFELFLFSYAVLGPLHYVTEISWLQKKQYFIAGKKDWIALIVICSLAAFFFFIIELSFYFKDSVFLNNFLQNHEVKNDEFLAILSLLTPILVFVTFASAYILTYIKDWFWRFNSFVAAIFLSLLLLDVPAYFLIFGILITTLIHVWLFTGLFMLSGAVKSKNMSSYISLVVFALCSLSFVFMTREGYLLSGQALEVVNSDAGFLGLNKALAKMFGLSSENLDLISSAAGLKIQAFIAFAYTYHYLNWFSKVEIIKWHKVSKTALTFCIVIWIIALAAYFYSYSFGWIALFFLSLMHVFLEFPLNFRSIEIIFSSKK